MGKKQMIKEEICPVCGCDKDKCACGDECESCGAQMKDLKLNAALIIAVILQAVGLVWYISKIDSKVDILYTTFEEENQKEVIENQVKMKMDLENIIQDVKELRQVVKKLKNKDADIQKTNKKIIKQHDKLFELIEGSNTNSNSNYSYGD